MILFLFSSRQSKSLIHNKIDENYHYYYYNYYYYHREKMTRYFILLKRRSKQLIEIYSFIYLSILLIEKLTFHLVKDEEKNVKKELFVAILTSYSV